MSKLDQLKEWFTLEDAAKYISKKIDEPITVSTLYRSAIDENLKLSVYFVNGAYGVKGELFRVAGVENQPQQKVFDEKDNTVNAVKGIWDLTMQGNEALEIKGYFEKINSGLSVTTQSKNGVLLQQGGITCQLYKYFDREKICNPKYNETEERRRAIEEEPMRAYENHPMIINPRVRSNQAGSEFSPCSRLSEVDGVLIIKSSEVNHFIQSLEATSKDEKPLATNEKNSLLVLIAALCKEADVDWNQRGITTSLVAMTDLIGAPLSDETIRKILKQIDPAIDSRSK
tara:strand:- start:9465 stop:10322 length:858 start_codon:yes stop_codon:yes gene_type:complete